MPASPSTPTKELPHAYRGGLIFLGVYVSVVALIALFVFTAGGHMSGLLLAFPALPWPLLGKWLFGFTGFGIGVWAGLIINAFLAFALGWAIFRLRS